MARKRRSQPDEVQRFILHAQEHVPCGDCGAAPGEPCSRPGSGRTVHKARYIAGAIALKGDVKASRRTPEQDAILATLPRVPKAEIEACRTPKGGYSFTRTWFLEHGLPYPPITGWRHAVERDDPKIPTADQIRTIAKTKVQETVNRAVRASVAAAEHRKARERAALTVECPTCGSPPGAKCESAGSTRKVKPYSHAPRIRYAGMLP